MVRPSYMVAEDALEAQPWVEPVADLVDGVHQQRDAAQREVLALQRDDHARAQAVQALIVSRPSEGWQSMSTKS